MRGLLGRGRGRAGRRGRAEARTTALRVLKSLLRLCSRLGYQQLAGSVYCLLSRAAACPALTREAALALEAGLGAGLELASHSQDCWKHIFTLTQFVAEQERAGHRAGGGAVDQPSVPRPPPRPSLHSPEEGEVWLGFSARPAGEAGHSVGAVLGREEEGVAGAEQQLEDAVRVRVITALSHQAERLLSRAAAELGLAAWLGYLQELVFTSAKAVNKAGSRM